MKSLAGKLLTASRQLRDPNFMRTVVLLLEHGEHGALGVILNRVSDRPLSGVWEAIQAEPLDCDQPINLGGPVQGPLIALHSYQAAAEKQVLPGLYLSLQRDSIDRLVRQRKQPFRVYSGNSGWGGGQLEGELKAGGWLLAPATREDVFAPSESLWQQVTSRIGLGIMLPGVPLPKLPPDPASN